MTPGEKRQRLRAILTGPKCVSPVTVFDALSARIADSVGCEAGILSGSVCAATMLAAPDMALQTLTEFADQVRRVTRVSNLSLFVDADQGYGNALSARRTVEELEHAGVAGLSIEDLVMPAHFGAGVDELISTGEMTGKLRAALAARTDPLLVIAARTASLRVESIASVVARVRAYAATGVDAIFITGLRKLEDLDAIRASVTLPIITGSAPGLKRDEIAAHGVRFCLQGHQPVAAAAKALRDTYAHFHGGGAPDALVSRIASPEEMARYIGAETYGRWREEYL